MTDSAPAPPTLDGDLDVLESIEFIKAEFWLDMLSGAIKVCVNILVAMFLLLIFTTIIKIVLRLVKAIMNNPQRPVPEQLAKFIAAALKIVLWMLMCASSSSARPSVCRQGHAGSPSPFCGTPPPSSEQYQAFIAASSFIICSVAAFLSCCPSTTAACDAAYRVAATSASIYIDMYDVCRRRVVVASKLAGGFSFSLPPFPCGAPRRRRLQQ